MFTSWGKNNSININGKTYYGKNVVVNNNQVIVDGVIQSDDLSTVKEIIIKGTEFEGNLEVHGSVTVHGDVEGDISAGGSVTCENVEGNLMAGGSIKCKDVVGNIRAGGSIRHG